MSECDRERKKEREISQIENESGVGGGCWILRHLNFRKYLLKNCVSNSCWRKVKIKHTQKLNSTSLNSRTVCVCGLYFIYVGCVCIFVERIEFTWIIFQSFFLCSNINWQCRKKIPKRETQISNVKIISRQIHSIKWSKWPFFVVVVV